MSKAEDLRAIATEACKISDEIANKAYEEILSYISHSAKRGGFRADVSSLTLKSLCCSFFQDGDLEQTNALCSRVMLLLKKDGFGVSHDWAGREYFILYITW